MQSFYWKTKRIFKQRDEKISEVSQWTSYEIFLIFIISTHTT